LEKTKGTALNPLIAPDMKPNEYTDNHLQDKMQDLSSTSPMLAILSEIWSSFVSFTKTSHFRAVVLAGFVAVMLLMQVPCQLKKASYNIIAWYY
jgi:hypothetical protein